MNSSPPTLCCEAVGREVPHPRASTAEAPGLRAGEAAPDLPAGCPELIIEPPAGWQPIQFGELWRSRELLAFFLWRDIKIQYKQTVLGPLWAVLRPVANMLVFSVLFGTLARIPSEGLPYPLFVYAGLLPWALFSHAVSESSMSLVSHAHLLSKVYFPRLLLPISGCGGAVVNFGVGMVIYAGLMLFYGQAPGAGVLLLPVLMLLTVLAALSVGCLLASMAVMYRDVRFVVGSLLQLWMYATPVVYPTTLIPERFRWLLELNPMTGIIRGFRSALLNQPVDVSALLGSAAFILAMLLPAMYVFRRTERNFADVA